VPGIWEGQVEETARRAMVGVDDDGGRVVAYEWNWDRIVKITVHLESS